jgi:hypothetical protein
MDLSTMGVWRISHLRWVSISFGVCTDYGDFEILTMSTKSIGDNDNVKQNQSFNFTR